MTSNIQVIKKHANKPTGFTDAKYTNLVVVHLKHIQFITEI